MTLPRTEAEFRELANKLDAADSAQDHVGDDEMGWGSRSAVAFIRTMIPSAITNKGQATTRLTPINSTPTVPIKRREIDHHYHARARDHYR
jgi:hypothetical protein